MAVLFQAVGTAVSGNTNQSPAWPTHQTDDIALCWVETQGGQVASLATANGFAEVTNSPQIASTGAGTSSRLTLFWCRATSGAMAAPVITVDGTFNHVLAVITTYRGAVTSGNPWDVTAGNHKDTASAAVTLSSVTTTVVNTLVVIGLTSEVDSASPFASAYVNLNLGSITERFDAGTTQGNGGAIAVIDGTWATTGACGTTAAVVTTSVNAYMTVALKPLLGISGTAATTNAADTVAASGAIASTGTLAKTNANDTSAASGAVTGNDVTGTSSTTNAADTSSASGLVKVTGTSSTSNANDTLASSGAIGLTGTLAATNANDAVVASGALTVSGSASTTNANDASAGAGAIASTGSSSTSNANDTSAASGGLTVSGSAATTNGNDTSAAAGAIASTGTSATANADDTSVAFGTVGSGDVTGAADAVNADDTSSASGTVTVTGTLARSNANDTSSASGALTVTGTSSTTNAEDTSAAIGALTVSGTSATTNADDTIQASGTVSTPANMVRGGYKKQKPKIWKNEREAIRKALRLAIDGPEQEEFETVLAPYIEAKAGTIFDRIDWNQVGIDAVAIKAQLDAIAQEREDEELMLLL